MKLQCLGISHSTKNLVAHEIGLSASLLKPGEKGSATAEPVAGSAKISAGSHVVQLETNPDGQEWVTTVSLEHEVVIKVKEPKEWNQSSGLCANTTW